jgi:hypothetical protein
VTSVFWISFDFNEKSIVPIIAWCCPVFLVLFTLDLVAGKFSVRYF